MGCLRNHLKPFLPCAFTINSNLFLQNILHFHHKKSPAHLCHRLQIQDFSQQFVSLPQGKNKGLLRVSNYSTLWKIDEVGDITTGHYNGWWSQTKPGHIHIDFFLFTLKKSNRLLYLHYTAPMDITPFAAIVFLSVGQNSCQITQTVSPSDSSVKWFQVEDNWQFIGYQQKCVYLGYLTTEDLEGIKSWWVIYLPAIMKASLLCCIGLAFSSLHHLGWGIVPLKY